MLNLEPWAKRLEGAAPCPVEIAADVQEALTSRASAAVLLVPMRENVTHSELSDGARHRIRAEVGLITSVSRSKRRFSGASRDQLNALRQPLLQELINWMPPASDIEVRWQSGELLNMDAQSLFWVDVLTTEYWWTS
ncbi:MAG: hypothetical protein HLX50_06650 [Alteromonadaceae bacterium]|nr:hypothetical protein [Alteromonadaceae bacterium]